MVAERDVDQHMRAAYDGFYGDREQYDPQADLIAGALDEALAERSETRPKPGRSSRRLVRWSWIATGFVSAAAGAALVLWFVARSEAPAPTNPASEVVLDELPEFGGADVRELEPSKLSWDETTRTLTVEEGAIRIYVDPTEGRRYQVATERFLVQVTGTIFEVTPSEVSVERGSVRLLDPQGLVLDDSLTAGETWTAPSKQEESGAAPTAADAVPDASELLDRAAAEISRGKTQAARSLIERALKAEPTRGETARADMLLADCSQLEGRSARAESLYEKSSSHDESEKQAQAALFSAARLAARRGETDKAKSLFRKYLRDYPNGVLHREAVRRLRQLDAAKSRAD